MGLPERLAQLRAMAARSGDTRMLDLGVLDALEELAEQVAALSLELVRHATSGHEPPRR
jgi:hypothetical protein